MDPLVSLCTTCQGTGFLDSQACPNCFGSSYTITIDKKIFYYPIPAYATPGKTRQKAIASNLTFAAGILCAGVSATSFVMLTQNAWPSLGRIFWQPGLYSASFGISTLLGIGVITKLLSNRTNHYSLLEIEALEEGPRSHSLQAYTSLQFQDFLDTAAQSASMRGAAFLDVPHLIVSLLEIPRIQVILARTEVSPIQLVEELKLTLDTTAPKSVRSLEITQKVRELILLSVAEAYGNQFQQVQLEDILLTYLKSSPETLPIFEQLGITYTKLLAVSRWYASDEARHARWQFWTDQARSKPKSFMNRAWTALPTPFLDSVGKDLTLLASYGYMSEGTSRQQEIERTIDALSGGVVKNVILIGDPGSGKLSILKAIATKILEDSVPTGLKDKRLVELELNQLLTQRDGVAKLQTLLNEVSQAGNVILAIPDVKVLAGSGESLDGSTILANALKNGEIQVITTASFPDYHRYVEQNSSLKGQLQVVELHNLSPQEVIPVLEAFTAKLESTYDVTITYPAIEVAATLAPRYLAEYPAPSGAKQILEAACKQAKKQGKSWVRKQEVEKGIESLVQVPVRQAAGKEAEVLLNLEATLHQRVIGQEVAVKAVAESLKRARSGLGNTTRPIGSFLFVGPTGVGKTELAKALCESYFGPESSMQRFDMSEYQNADSIATLIGTPDSQGGTLTQVVREKPFSLILFDELEKAHPDILNLFLQVLDDGRLTEASGRTVSFVNTIIIATSNAQARLVGDAVMNNQSQTAIMQILEANFRPEFLNRFDGIVPFVPLNKSELLEVTKLLCAKSIAKAAERGITLTIDDGALEKLVALGFDPLYGARPLRRVVEQKIEGILANLILSQQIHEGDSLQIVASMLD